jgi:hypothetical protein
MDIVEFAAGEFAAGEFAAGATRLGLADDEVRELVELRRGGECAPVHRRMAELVGARVARVRASLDDALAEQAAAGGVSGGAEPMERAIPLAKAAGVLQAAEEILAAAPATGGCGDGCACSRAASVTAGGYRFSATTVTAEGAPLVCTLDADGDNTDGDNTDGDNTDGDNTDGGSMQRRLGEWRAVLAGATGREEIEDGIAVSFGHGVERTAELGRLLAAEYSCCSFASYHLTIDARGVRMEVRAPAEARDALAAVFGT